MIEFQLTVYMCSYCTRVHNAAHDCVRHELEEHSTNITPMTTDVVIAKKIDEVDDTAEPSTSSTVQPFTIVDDDVKPDVDESDFQSAFVDLDKEQESVENKATNDKKENTEESPTVYSFDNNVKPGGSQPPNLFHRRQPRNRAHKSTKLSGTLSSPKPQFRPIVSCEICGKVCQLLFFYPIYHVQLLFSSGYAEDEYAQSYAKSHWRKTIQMPILFYAI